MPLLRQRLDQETGPVERVIRCSREGLIYYATPIDLLMLSLGSTMLNNFFLRFALLSRSLLIRSEPPVSDTR